MLKWIFIDNNISHILFSIHFCHRTIAIEQIFFSYPAFQFHRLYLICSDRIKSYGKTATRAQFHQRSTYSFYACRSQKRKKILTTWLTLTLLGTTCVKSARKYVGEIDPWCWLFSLSFFYLLGHACNAIIAISVPLVDQSQSHQTFIFADKTFPPRWFIIRTKIYPCILNSTDIEAYL